MAAYGLISLGFCGAEASQLTTPRAILLAEPWRIGATSDAATVIHMGWPIVGAVGSSETGARRCAHAIARARCNCQLVQSTSATPARVL
eukprot:362074-Chlamydomonas_euryale.AAC.3